MTAGKPRWVGLWSFTSRFGNMHPGKFSWTLCRFGHRQHNPIRHLISPVSQLFSVSRCSIYAKNLIYDLFYVHFLISACADLVEEAPEIKNIWNSGVFSLWCEDRANRGLSRSKGGLGNVTNIQHFKICLNQLVLGYGSWIHSLAILKPNHLLG